MDAILIGFMAGVLFLVIYSKMEKRKKKELEMKKIKEYNEFKKWADKYYEEHLESEHTNEKKKLNRMISERDDLIEKMEELEDDDDSIDDNTMLISENAFEDMYRQLSETYNLIRDICRKSDFQNFILGISKEGNDKMDDSKKMFEGLKFFIGQDILRNYERLGHKYYINDERGKKCCDIDFDTPEGQLLSCIVLQFLRLDDNQRYTWEEFKTIIVRKEECCKKIRSLSVEALNSLANAEVKATASDGLDDFAFCMIFHDYNQEYETNYRKKMLRIATIIANADNKLTDTESQWLDSIMNVGVTKDSKENEHEVESPDVELNSMIGLSRVKNEINTLCNFVIMKKKREKEGLKLPNISFHCVFTGNPGTGKTTVARLLAGIYKDLGVLKKGHLVETDRSGLVAEYVGQTAIKTNKIIDSALDGVLFIDEAYTLANGGTNDYGPEAIATLLKRMEDDRDRLVVILAGYTVEIEQFINSNPGLRSRFNRYIHFDDYTAEELYEIFCLQVKKSDYTLAEDASESLKEHLKNVVENKPKDFGNARYVRNLFEKAIEAQCNRLALKEELTKQDLTLITKDDIFSLTLNNTSQESWNQQDKKQSVTLNHLSYIVAKRETETNQEADEKDNTIQTLSKEVKDLEKYNNRIDKPTPSSYSTYDEETIEISYTILCREDLGENTFDMDVKERDYDWLTDKEEEGEYLDSDFISENRRGLHKRIVKAIRQNMEEELFEETYSLVDDEIEYTITV
ncbi:MAG: AAA family ATPase [Prevotella sp.]|nr:AAA family ATPase [Prevotella sp.]